MPIPIPPGGPTPTIPPPAAPARPVTGSPYYVREHQGWAVEQERAHHNEALYYVGEWVVFFLMWTAIDERKGLVGRCHRCFTSGDQLADRVSAIYKQPTQQRCPVCYGTTFEGGFRARIVRPAILSEVDEVENKQKRGQVHPARLTVNTETDFRVRNGDYMIRADNTRWQLGVPSRTTLRSGFEHPGQAPTALNYSGLSAMFEEPTTVSYLLPPATPQDIAAVLSQPMASGLPSDFSGFEVKRGPLLPPSYLD